MVKILESFVVTVFLIIIEIYCSKLIGNILSEYYESEIVKTFKEEWVKYKKPFENAIMTNIKENYGGKSMNIYMKHVRDTFKITRGFYLSDNIVNVVFSDMILRNWPNLIMPEVSLSLPGNLLKVEATVGKMFVDTVYRMMRNESAVLYSEAELDKAKHSPFSLQQVHSTGKLTIVAEDCFLSGFSIVSLLGSSVTVGHSTFRLVDCKFTVEISSDVGTPPVMAPYFPRGPGKQIESLLSRPIRDELVQNLQGAIYSYINTSVVFGKELPKYIFNQQKLFKKTSYYLTGLCRKLNTLTLEAQKGSIELSDFESEMETKTDKKQSTVYLSLKELKLYGLDTAYASRSGGSFEASQLSVADSIRFYFLQVRGKASYDNGTQYTHNFAVELTNVHVHVIINVEKDGSNSVHKFEVVLGRTFGFSVLPWETDIDARLWIQALVCGYIVNEVPARITEHLSSVMTPAANDDEKEDLKFYEDNSHSGEITKKVQVILDDNTADETVIESSEKPAIQSENENDSKQSKTDTESDNNSESPENLSNKTQEGDVGIMVTAPEALLKSDISAGDETIRGTEIESNNNKEVLTGSDSDFFSDDKGKKPFFSDFENKQTDKQTLADGKSDDVLDKNFFTDNDGQKKFISDGDGEKHPVESEENINNNSKMTDNKEHKSILIFASSENHGDKLNDDIAEQSDQSAPIERNGKNIHVMAKNNRKRPAKKIHKRDKKELNSPKMTLRRNPRANTTKVQIRKMTRQGLKHLQTSKLHNKTRLVQNEVHMSENEIR